MWTSRLTSQAMWVPRGSEFQTAPVDGVPCRFRTCSDVNVWPLEEQGTALIFPPFRSDEEAASRASCAIRISLETMAGIPLSELKADRLRFQICGELEPVVCGFSMRSSTTASP